MFTDRQARAALLFAAVFLVVAAVGCAVGPDFRPPQTHMPSGWAGPTSAPASRPSTPAALADLAHWWKKFNDPTLSSLMDRAVESNLDLKQAQARIMQARANRGIVFAGLGPMVGATSAYNRSRAPTVTPSGNTTGAYKNFYQAGLDASWEIDVFGGIRRNVEAADADVQAAIEDKRLVLVTLTAEVALNYIDLRGFQQQIVIAKDNLKAQKHVAEVTRQKQQGGLIGSLDVANADAVVATTASLIPLMEQSAQQTIYNLGVLLGREPADLLHELSPVAGIPPAPPLAPIGIPSDLLRQRPDIRQAEAQIHAATARIGAATADLLPKFIITGSGALQSNQSRTWFDWVNRVWSFGPSISWTLWDTGRILSNIEVQKSVQEQSLLTYRQTVLIALQDVENALIATAKEQEHRKWLMEAVAANRKAMELSTQLYAQGQTDFLNVLNAERSLLGTEDALIQSTRTVSTNLVSLYKALGGGWSEEAPPTAKDKKNK